MRETEYGYRKRCGERALRESGLGHAIVRAASLNELLIEEGLHVKGLDESDLATCPDPSDDGADEESRAAGLTQEDIEGNRIHPRDVARTLVAALRAALRAGVSVKGLRKS